MGRRRITPIMIAGLLALLSAFGLFALISSGGLVTQIDPTAQQQTVNAIVQTRLALTAQAQGTRSAEATATQQAAPDVTLTASEQP